VTKGDAAELRVKKITPPHSSSSDASLVTREIQG